MPQQSVASNHPTASNPALQQAITEHLAGRLEAAERGYLVLLEREPDHAEVHYNLGTLKLQQGHFGDALPHFVAALQSDASNGQYWIGYIDALYKAGQVEDAKQVLELARQQGLAGSQVDELAARIGIEPVRPDRTSAQHNPGNQEIDQLLGLFGQGRFAEAASAAEALTVRYPHHEFGWKALGAVYKQLNRAEDALHPMQRAAELAPGDVEAHYNLGVTLQELGRLNDAREAYQRALQIDPGYADAHANLGVVAQSLGEVVDAQAHYRRAIELKPGHALAHHNLGSLLLERGDFTGAEASLRRALQHNAQDVRAWIGLGEALKAQARPTEAAECYRSALRLDPGNAPLHYNLGNLQKALGQPGQAEASYRSAVAIAPDFAKAHYNLGAILQDRGAHAEAVASYLAALQAAPDYVDAHYNLGTAFEKIGRLEEACASYRRALELNPGYAAAHYNLGNALGELGRLDEAGAHYREAINLAEDKLPAYCNLGNLLTRIKKFDEAEGVYREALAIDPDNADAHYNLGNTLRETGRLAEAEASYRRAIALRSDFAESHYNLGITLYDLGRADEAEGCFRNAIRIKPDYQQAYSNLGRTLNDLGRLNEAEECYRELLRINQSYADAHNNLGIALRDQGKSVEAEASYRRALEIMPDYAEVHSNLGITLQELGRLDEAEKSLMRALEIEPGCVQAHCNLAVTQLEAGRPDEAAQSIRRALQFKPDWASMHSNLIFILDMTADAGTAFLQQERRRWAELHANALHQHRPFSNVPDPERRLRIGYVSADFRMHSAAFAFGAMLSDFDAGHFEVYAYSNSAREDVLTRNFQRSVSCWRTIFGLSDDAVADLIREDGIDILVDLSGHTAGNRLLVFARKPAPIQITAWGYAAGTGMDAMDVLFSDPVFIPPEEQPLYAEKIVYLSSAIGFFESHRYPDVGELPARSNGCITFGSFNRLAKSSPEVYEVWAQVLNAVPGSRMILKTAALDDEPTRERILSYFRRAGVAESRIVMQGQTSRDDHLAAFNQIDIALDPFPHGGGVTALEGLMMGVPVVTLKWPTLTGRVSSSILTSLQLTDWIADTREQYVDIAVQNAHDLQSLAELRGSLRSRFLSSAIGDQKAYVRAAECEYRRLWRQWCSTEAGDADGQ